MTTKLFILLTITSIFISSYIFAQEFTPAQLNYQQQELFVNPAYTGTHNALSGAASVQVQWSGFDKAPNTQRLQLHSPVFNDKTGLGLSFQHESYGITRNFNLSAYYAYKIVTDKGTLSLGLHAGFATSQEKYAELNTPVPDPLFSENTQLMWGFTTGVGAYYYDSMYYIGLSAPRIIDNTLKTGEGKLSNTVDFEKIPFYLTAGYVFALGSSFRIKPAALVSYSSEYNFGYNANLTAYYKSRCWLGAIARYNKQAGAFVGVNIENYVNIHYMFTFNYGDAFAKMNQSAIHEISLSLQLNPKNGERKFYYF